MQEMEQEFHQGRIKLTKVLDKLK